MRVMIWVLNPLLFMLVVGFMSKGPECCPLCSWVVSALLYVKYAVLSLCPQAVHTVYVSGLCILTLPQMFTD